jgi:MFS family permease
MRSGRVFFGWYIVAAFAVMALFSAGLRFAVGPFLKPMVADLAVDRASFSLVISLSLLLYGVCIPVIGRLMERVGTRIVVVGGALLLGGALATTGLITRLWQFYLLYGVGASVGLAAISHVVGVAVIARWFVKRRATALSILAGASAAGMSLLTPVLAWLILTLGWRWTFLAVGVAAVAVVVPLGFWVIRDSPEAMGLSPDGGPGRPGAAPDVAGERTEMSVAVQTLPFWQIAASLFCCGFSMSLLSAHGVPMLTDHGYSAMTASWALGLAGGSSMAFSVVIGDLADRYGRRPMMAWLYFTRALIFLGLFTVRDSPVVLLLVALMAGTSMSGSTALGSALTADIFGRFSVGSIFGTIFLVHQVGSALGSWLGGLLFETTGGYGPAFLSASALLVAASAVSLTIDESTRHAPRLSPVAGGR